MIDLKLTQDASGVWDLSISNGDLEGVEGFDTAIFSSLLTDARAPESIVLKPENRRGWMGNLASTVDGRDFGGLLWLVNQRRLTQETLNEAVDYARQALDWLVEDGLASNIEVTGTIVPRSGITLEIVITSPEGETVTHYVPLWEVTGNAN
jgi:phage gp46-like protein